MSIHLGVGGMGSGGVWVTLHIMIYTSGADLEGGGVGGGVGRNPENNIFSVIRGYFYMHISKISGSLRSPIIISIYICWKSQGCSSFRYFLHLLLGNWTPTYIPVHANFSESVKEKKEKIWLSPMTKTRTYVIYKESSK